MSSFQVQEVKQKNFEYMFQSADIECAVEPRYTCYFIVKVDFGFVSHRDVHVSRYTWGMLSATKAQLKAFRYRKYRIVYSLHGLLCSTRYFNMQCDSFIKLSFQCSKLPGKQIVAAQLAVRLVRVPGVKSPSRIAKFIGYV